MRGPEGTLALKGEHMKIRRKVTVTVTINRDKREYTVKFGKIKPIKLADGVKLQINSMHDEAPQRIPVR